MINYIYSRDPIAPAALAVFNSIDEHLARGERVLLLLSGGSNIRVAADLDKMLHGIKLSNLSVTLMDERYGPIGHPDENWQHLIDAGFNLPDANVYRPLIGQDIEKTTSEFSKWLSEQLEHAVYKIGLFGIGSDGHTAGIKPNSPAVSTDELVVNYAGIDYKRITIGFDAIRKLDEAVVQASGVDKIPTLHDMMYNKLPLKKQPAQILKSVPKLTIISNNKKEDIK